MNLIASLIGSGAGVVIIGVSLLAIPHLGRFPAAIQPWLRRLLIIATFAGGSALAVTELGSLWASLASWAAGFFGGFGSGIPHTVVILAGTALLLATAAALVWAPGEGAAVTAAILPAVLMLVPGGFLHQVFAGTTYPAAQLAASFTAWIGG